MTRPRAHAPVRLRWSPRSLGRVGLIVGAAGGAAMAAVLVLYGFVAGGHSAWDAPMAVWAWVFGVEHFGTPAEHAWPIVLGTLAHLANAVAVGLVFTLVAAGVARGDAASPVVLGILYALGLWVLMRHLVLPLNAGEAQLFTGAAVAPGWVWWLAHAAFGASAGIAFHAARRTVPRRRDRPAPVEVAERRRVLALDEGRGTEGATR